MLRFLLSLVGRCGVQVSQVPLLFLHVKLKKYCLPHLHLPYLTCLPSRRILSPHSRSTSGHSLRFIVTVWLLITGRSKCLYQSLPKVSDTEYPTRPSPSPPCRGLSLVLPTPSQCRPKICCFLLFNTLPRASAVANHVACLRWSGLWHCGKCSSGLRNPILTVWWPFHLWKSDLESSSSGSGFSFLHLQTISFFPYTPSPLVSQVIAF